MSACGRPVSARGLCQTHYRQARNGGSDKPIRPYRQRRAGTRKLQGLSVSNECAATIEQCAMDVGKAPAAIIADVLEAWAKHQRQKAAKSKAARDKPRSRA